MKNGAMSEYIPGAKHPIKAWISGVSLEESAKQQLLNVANMPFIHKHVAVMPDAHWGMGATVGSVIATKGAIIPAAVGVDIGCGMMAVRTSLTAGDLPDNLFALRSKIEAAVPHGRTNDGGEGDRGAWGVPPFADRAQRILSSLKDITSRHPKLVKAANRAPHHAGTLGTGNHFIEVCLDEESRVWIMLHSGSRGIGNAIGRYFIEAAKEDMRRWFINLPDADLAYIPQGSALFGDYVAAVHWAQDFAKINRRFMMEMAIAALGEVVSKPWYAVVAAVECHHNYVSFEEHFGESCIITRKGAIAAHPGVLGIIPGSMGAKSFIVRGKGNRDSFHSCSHGAGRVMSRGEARKRITVGDHAAATAGVECRKDAEVLDESPAAYKDIDAVMAAQSELTEVVYTLKQVLCVKG